MKPRVNRRSLSPHLIDHYPVRVLAGVGLDVLPERPFQPWQVQKVGHQSSSDVHWLD